MIAERSRKALAGVHPDLVKVIERADELDVQFVVVCGRRTLAEQKTLVATGKSKTLHSRHLTGHAVDLVDTKFTWSEAAMLNIAAGIKQAAADVNVPIEWGGDWKSFVDTPHFQLPFASYPDDDQSSHVSESAPNSTESVANSLAAPANSPAVKPLAKSQTIWGSLGTAVAGAGLYLEQAFQTGVQSISAMNDLAPIRDTLSQVGANGKSIMLGFLAFCVALVISRRVKASQEGKPG